MRLFRGFEGAHGTHGVPEREPGSLKASIKKTARTVREPVTIELWEKHLSGERPLGVIPIRSDGTCTWGGIDFDEYDVDVLDVVARVHARGLSLVPSRSKSGGLHLWMFLSEPAPASLVLSTLRDLASAIGIARSEIFPKQVEVLVERGDVGNWIVAPHFGSTYGGVIREQRGIKKTGAEMTAEEFLAAAEKSLHVLSPTRAALSQPGAGPLPPGAMTFDDGPPCLQHLARQGFPEGNRNRALFMIGIYARRRDPTGWRAAVEAANRDLMRPPLEADEVSSVVRSLQKREYSYTCRQEPMVSFCNAAVCRTRRHGVGEEGNVPRISGVSMQDGDPPVWFLDVDDERLVLYSVDELLNYVAFNRACTLQLQRTYHPMKQSDWTVAVSAAMQSIVRVDAPPELGPRGRLEELLEEFLTNRHVGDDKDSLPEGRPYEDQEEGRYYFRLSDFESLCKREEFKWHRNKTGTEIRKMGGGAGRKDVKGRNINVFWLPTRLFSRREPLSTPPRKKTPL